LLLWEAEAAGASSLHVQGDSLLVIKRAIINAANLISKPRQLLQKV
jgi:hypothetical protein